MVFCQDFVESLLHIQVFRIKNNRRQKCPECLRNMLSFYISILFLHIQGIFNLFLFPMENLSPLDIHIMQMPKKPLHSFTASHISLIYKFFHGSLSLPSSQPAPASPDNILWKKLSLRHSHRSLLP